MAYLGEYTEVGWQNEPSRATPINAHNLGVMEDGIKRLFYYLLAGGGTGGGSATDGREVELRNNGEYIQWKYSGDEEWVNLVSLSDLKGEKGDDYVLTEEDILKIAEKVKIDAPDSAVDISFENEGTNLESTDVQGAIGELSGQKIDHPSTGQVGQILEIESVDENGKPKTYKAVEKPQGGGEVSDEQIADAVKDYLTENPPSEVDISTLTAYDAGGVMEIKRNDTIYDKIIPLMNTKYLGNRKTVAIEPEQTNGVNNVIHELTVLLASGNDGVVVYFENMAGTTQDYASAGLDTRVRCRYIKRTYGITNYDDIRISNPVDLMGKGTIMHDDTVAVGGAGTCIAFRNDSKIFVIGTLYDSNSKLRNCVTYTDVYNSSGWDLPTGITWSKPEPLMLTVDGVTEEYTSSRLALACGLESATIQANNQVWYEASKSLFYTAINIKSQGVAVLTSSDGINWTYKGFFTTKYKCKFSNESACAFRNDRLWIASKNNNVSSTTTEDKNFSNYLTLLKINTSTWQKVDEYNIPDCGCKPFFIPPSYAVLNGTKAVLLMHNPYTRDTAGILALGDYPLYYLGELNGGANYVTAYATTSAGRLNRMLVCGTNGLVTERTGGLLRVNIGVSERTEDISVPINEWFSYGNKGKLTFSGASTDTYDGSENKTVEIPKYELPIATSDNLGGIKAPVKNNNSIERVYVDETGKLWCANQEMSYTLKELFLILLKNVNYSVDMSETLTQFENELMKKRLGYELGSIDYQSGEETTGTNRIRTDFIAINGEAISIGGNVEMAIRYYDSDKNFVGVESGSWNKSYTNVNMTHPYARFSMRKNDNGNISLNELDGTILTVGEVKYELKM